jgi:hypothetical protein
MAILGALHPDAPQPNPQNLGYRELAWALVNGAARDYHLYYNWQLRRERVLQKTRHLRLNSRRRKMAEQFWEAECKRIADSAFAWMDGAGAAYPWSLACAWLGWEPEALRDRICGWRTGENLAA